MNTDVKIMGRTFAVRSELDDSFVVESANLVNEKMNGLLEKSSPASTEKVAILTALNLAGEMLKIKREDSSRRTKLRAHMDRLLKLTGTRK